MNSRPYCLRKRRISAEATRQRIVDAARTLLAATDGQLGFSLDAVARRAGVTRMTVYHQFESKGGLLEALCDTLAIEGGMQELGSVFLEPDGLKALDALVAAFCRFWNSDRIIIRRLRALAALDADFEAVIKSRDNRRKGVLTVLVKRIAEQAMAPRRESVAQTVETLHALTSFELFDSLSGKSLKSAKATRTIQNLARSVLKDEI